jgi:hypothetical protein
MAKVIRLDSGGFTVEQSSIRLSIEQAKELAAQLAAVGEPPGCCWCVGLDEDEEETDR